jgi:putative MATE family efflux protein
MLPKPTVRVVLALAVPVLAQYGLNQVVILSDSIIAGRLEGVGEAGAAIQNAQTTAHYLAWAITSYTVLVTVGSTALVARFVGAGDLPTARDTTHQSLLLGVFFAGIATAAGLAGGIDALVRLLNLHDESARLAGDFLRVLFALLVFQVTEQIGVACLVGAGDTRTGLVVMIGVATANVPLAWSFGFGFGPIPALGFVGIAVGTALSHVFGCLVVLVVLIRGRYGLWLSLHRFRPNFGLMLRLLRISVPAAIDNLSLVAGQLWFLSLVNQLGVVAGAAHGIALRWEALGYLSGSAFGTAAMTLVGQNLGAARPDLAKRSGWLAFGLGALVMSTMGVIFYVFAWRMFHLLAPTRPEIIEAGVPALQLVAFAMPGLAATIVLLAALRGAGDTRVPVLFTLIGFFAVRIPLAYLLIRPSVTLPGGFVAAGADLGLIGAWLAMLIDIDVRATFFLTRFLRGAWLKTKV